MALWDTRNCLVGMLVDQNPWAMPCLGQSGQSTFQNVLAEVGRAAAWGLHFKLWCQVEGAPTIFLLFCQLLNL